MSWVLVGSPTFRRSAGQPGTVVEEPAGKIEIQEKGKRFEIRGKESRNLAALLSGDGLAALPGDGLALLLGIVEAVLLGHIVALLVPDNIAGLCWHVLALLTLHLD